MDTDTGLELSSEQCLRIIEDVETRWTQFREKVGRRRAHFFAEEEADPDLGDQWKGVISYQTDIPRRSHAKLKARLTENHFMVRVKPIKDIPSQRSRANDLEQVFNTGFEFIEERERLDIQGFLADGQIIDGLTWLHWRKADHIWPAVPDYEERDEWPMCEMCEGTGKAAGMMCPECRGTGASDGLEYEYQPGEDDYAKGRYRESDKSFQARRKAETAAAGFPWQVEVPGAAAISALEDRSLEQGAAIIVLRRVVPVLDYLERVRAEKAMAQEVLSLNEANPRIPVYGEVEGPATGAASAGDYAKRVSVVELWTRTEFYEFCDYSGVSESGQGSGLTFIKGFRHPYEMPPFALCPAMEINDPEPHRRFLPVLEGVFRLKAMYDRLTALMLVMGEQTALPYYYWGRVGNGEPMLMEDGDKSALTFQRNSALAEVAPEGYELRKVEFNVTAAFGEVVRLMREEMEAAVPSAGNAEISASTQPWTVRLQQAQESVEPKALVVRAARAITAMTRNMALVMSKPLEDGGFGEMITTFKRVRNGAVSEDEVIGVEPKHIASLNIGVDIDADSSAEKITRIEHGMGLLARGLLTEPEFFEDYMGVEDGDEKWANLLAHAIYKEQILPMDSKQFVAEWGGKKFVLGPNGDIYGMGGAQVQPAQVLQANGVAPTPAPAPTVPAPAQMGQQMPSLPGLAGPEGSIPLGGMR